MKVIRDRSSVTDTEDYGELSIAGNAEMETEWFSAPAFMGIDSGLSLGLLCIILIPMAFINLPCGFGQV